MSKNTLPVTLGMPRILVGIIAVVFSSFLLAFLFSRVGTEKIIPLLSRAHPFPLFLALAINAVFPLFAAWRWKESARLSGLEMPFRKSLALFLAAWPIASITPAKAGDILRMWVFKKEGKGPAALASLVIERLFDLGVLAGLALLGCFFIAPFGLAIPIFLGFLFLLLLIALAIRWRGWDWIPARWRPPSSQHGTLRYKTIFSAVIASTCIWVLSAFQWQAVLYAFGMKSTFLDTFFRLPPALLAGMMPFTWSGVGIRDGAFLLVYRGQFPAEKILIASSLFTAIRYLVPGIVGLPWSLWMLNKLRKSKDQ